MTQCTRTRNIRFSTPLNDLLWNRDQDRQSSFIAAQESAQDPPFRPSVADILTSYDFARDDWHTFLTAQGQPTQAAMMVVSKSNPADRYLVIARVIDGGSGLDWTAEGDGDLDNAPTVIAAVQARIEANKAAKTITQAIN